MRTTLKFDPPIDVTPSGAGDFLEGLPPSERFTVWGQGPWHGEQLASFNTMEEASHFLDASPPSRWPDLEIREDVWPPNCPDIAPDSFWKEYCAKYRELLHEKRSLIRRRRRQR